jgi:hypothetical protein
MGQAEGLVRECRLALRRNQASPGVGHHECSRGQVWVVAVRSVSQKTCPRGRGLISDCGSGNSHVRKLCEGGEVSMCLRRMAEISSHWLSTLLRSVVQSTGRTAGLGMQRGGRGGIGEDE